MTHKLPAFMNKLPAFHQTAHGYESQSRDGRHTYVVTFNGIDYDVTHYWAEATQGELLGRTATPTTLAREHYASLQ